MTKILIPTPLRPFTDKLDSVDIDGATIGELLQNLTTKYGGLKQHLIPPTANFAVSSTSTSMTMTSGTCRRTRRR